MQRIIALALLLPHIVAAQWTNTVFTKDIPLLGSTNPPAKNQLQIASLGNMRMWIAFEQSGPDTGVGVCTFFNDLGQWSRVILPGVDESIAGGNFKFELAQNAIIIVNPGQGHGAMIREWRYGNEQPLPTNAVQWTSITVGDEATRDITISRLKSGAVACLTMQQTDSVLWGMLYRTQAGEWKDLGTTNVWYEGLFSSHKIAAAQHPVSDRLWAFDVEDTTCLISATRFVDTGNGIQFEGIITNFLTKYPFFGAPFDGHMTPNGEMTYMTAVPDPFRNQLLLGYIGYYGYGGIDLIANPVVTAIGPDGSKKLVLETLDSEGVQEDLAAPLSVIATKENIFMLYTPWSFIKENSDDLHFIVANTNGQSVPQIVTPAYTNNWGFNWYTRGDAFNLYVSHLFLDPTTFRMTYSNRFLTLDAWPPPPVPPPIPPLPVNVQMSYESGSKSLLVIYPHEKVTDDLRVKVYSSKKGTEPLSQWPLFATYTVSKEMDANRFPIKVPPPRLYFTARATNDVGQSPNFSPPIVVQKN